VIARHAAPAFGARRDCRHVHRTAGPCPSWRGSHSIVKTNFTIGGSTSVPGARRLHGLIRAVVLLHRSHRLRHALHARGEVRAVVARDDRRRRRGLELGLVQVPATSDAVDVLVLVLVLLLRTCRRKCLAFALRELRLSLHSEGKLQDRPLPWRQERRPQPESERIVGRRELYRTRAYEARGARFQAASSGGSAPQFHPDASSHRRISRRGADPLRRGRPRRRRAVPAGHRRRPARVRRRRAGDASAERRRPSRTATNRRGRRLGAAVVPPSRGPHRDEPLDPRLSARNLGRRPGRHPPRSAGSPTPAEAAHARPPLA